MSSLVNFCKRHKKKLIFTVVFFGGGYAGIKYSIYKLKECFQLSTKSSELMKKQMMSMRKYEHYLSIRETSDQGVLSLIKQMHNKINESLSSDDLLEKLKQKPSNKFEIWEELKIKCITKCLTSIYATSILTLFIKIELNILGANLFLRNSSEDTSSLGDKADWSNEFIQKQENTLSGNVQQKFLENIENFINCLPSLIEIVESCCTESFENVSLKETIDVEFLSIKIEELLIKINNKLFNSNEDDTFIAKFMLNLDLKTCCDKIVLLNDNRRIRSDEEVLKILNLETYDIMTSDDFQLCLDSLVKLMSDQFLDNLASSLVNQLISSNNEITEKSISIKLPFARLIPILNKSNLIFETNMIKNRILNNKFLNRFSENIYESYSISNREVSNDQNYMNASYNEDSMVNQVS